jgi:hypothetical protein
MTVEIVLTSLHPPRSYDTRSNIHTSPSLFPHLFKTVFVRGSSKKGEIRTYVQFAITL